MIYLDSAATSMQKPATVENAVVNAMRSMASPGRGGHSAAMRAAETVFDCRCAAAKLFKIEQPENVVFTFNATHGLNIAINSLAKKGDRVVVSGFEHNSVTRPLNTMGAEIDIAGTDLFNSDAVLEQFSSKIPGADMVVCTMVSNVFGYILPIYEISRLCSKHGVALVVDASQAAGVIDVDCTRLNAAFVALPGHKGLMGPQGTGILLCSDQGNPLISGGSGSDSISQLMPEYLPDRLEAGTHNVCGIAGLLAGMEYVLDKGIDAIFNHERRLLELACRELENIDGLKLYTGHEQTGVLSMQSDRLNCEALAEKLSERGICVRAGLHCAPYAHRSAGTLSLGTVRMSFSPFIFDTQLREACDAIREAHEKGADN